MLDRVLIAIAAWLLPAFVRDQYREQWLTDAANARSFAIGSGKTGLGALRSAVVFPRVKAEAQHFDPVEVAIGRADRGRACLLMSLVLVVAAWWLAASAFPTDAATEPWVRPSLSFTSLCFLLVALALVVAGFVSLWRGTIPGRRLGALGVIGTVLIGVALLTAVLLALPAGMLPGRIEFWASPAGTRAAGISLAVLAFASIVGLIVTSAGISRAMGRRPALRSAATSVDRLQRIRTVAWAGFGALSILGLVASLALPLASIGVALGPGLHAVAVYDPGAAARAWAAIAATPIVTAVFTASFVKRRLRGVGTNLSLVHGEAIRRVCWLWAVIVGCWFVADFFVRFAFFAALFTDPPMLGIGELFAALGPIFVAAAIWKGARDTQSRSPLPAPAAPAVSHLLEPQ